MKKLSCIIPVYNSKDTIGRCLESIIKCSSQDIEIIIINDGSTDDSEKEIIKYCRKDNRIVLINQDNAGVSEARNRGLEAAKGEYVTFIDSDDFILSDSDLFKQEIKRCDESQADILISGYKTSDGNQKILTEDEFSKDSLDGLIEIKSIGIPFGKIIRRKFLINNSINFPIGMKHQEDAVFYYRILDKAELILTSSKIHYSYQLPESSKKYVRNVLDIIMGVRYMQESINNLIHSHSSLSDSSRLRLRKRVFALQEELYSYILNCNQRKTRIELYRSIDWKDFVAFSSLHPLKLCLMRKRQFYILDLLLCLD